jgi:hypothetical protein
MSDTSRYHYHVTRLDLDRFTLRPAERDARGTAYDAKHLVGVRVIVMIGEDPVHPRAAPAVLREQFLAARGVQIRLCESLRVYEER